MTICRPIGQGRKWTFYIVQSVPLVNQQASSLRKHLPWNIGTFSGDMNVDFWSRDQWNNILSKCHVSILNKNRKKTYVFVGFSSGLISVICIIKKGGNL